MPFMKPCFHACLDIFTTSIEEGPNLISCITLGLLMKVSTTPNTNTKKAEGSAKITLLIFLTLLILAWVWWVDSSPWPWPWSWSWSSPAPLTMTIKQTHTMARTNPSNPNQYLWSNDLDRGKSCTFLTYLTAVKAKDKPCAS